MKPEFIDFIENARKAKGERFRHQLSIFLVCLMISVFLWILVRLSNDFVYTVDYHLQYTNIPENLKLVDVSDSILTLNIKVQGFDFFSEQYFQNRKRNFEVSIKNIKLKSHDNYVTGYLLTPPIGKRIADHTTYPLQINSTSPDTIYFRFERRNLKRLQSIKANIIPVYKTEPGIDTIILRQDSNLKNKKNPEVFRRQKSK